MSSGITRISFGAISALLLGTAAAAQPLRAPVAAERSRSEVAGSASGPIAAAVATVSSMPRQAVVRSGGGGRKGTAIGALVGAGVAAGITYWAASDYGNNEGGRFCTGCFVQWGAVTIPAGALVGAIVGHFVGGSLSAPQQGPRRPEAWLAPAIGRHGGGAVLSIRY